MPDVAPVSTTTKSFSGPLPALTDSQKALADELKRDVTVLASDIGDRNVFRYDAYMKAARYIVKQLEDVGYKPTSHVVSVRGRDTYNLEVELRGSKSPDEIIVVGAHYDSATGCPAANDNGSGVAATLAIARRFAKLKPEKTVRFVLFANEEPPYFQTEGMGSLAYARRCKARKENIVAMLSLETIGYYSDAPGSQNYPAPLSLMYPSTGNFIGFVGDTTSAKLVKQAIDSFRKHAKFPSEAASLPSVLQGVGWSDHWSFWQVGYPAVMVTDTAPFRYPHYHQVTDTPDKLDYERMARVVEGLEAVVREMAGVR
ncbi:MAG: M28 family peptidase [Pirellulales bacterium]|nr:M28 family peptidase [Pirellulales bacterium]